jgi:hypothetical protein
MLKTALGQGVAVVNFVGGQVALSLGFESQQNFVESKEPSTLTYYTDSEGRLTDRDSKSAQKFEIPALDPVFVYQMTSPSMKGCKAILYYSDNVVGYRCQIAKGTFFQVGALIFRDYNSSDYGQIRGQDELSGFLKSIASEFKVTSKIAVSSGAKQTVAFARKDPSKKLLWITVKTGCIEGQSLTIKLDPDLIAENLEKSNAYTVTDLLSQKQQSLKGSSFSLALSPNDSGVYIIEPTK